MSMKVIWSPTAKEEYAAILEYVDGNYGTGSALKLLDQTEKIINQITEFPNIYEASQKGNVRKAVITKQTSVIFRIKKEQIEILHFWDNRQNPEKLIDLIEE